MKGTAVTAAYFRTAHGSHRHADYSCANGRRRIGSGDPTAIPDAEVADWAPCEFCCTTSDHAAHTPTTAKARCANSGVAHPGSRRLHDTCRDCGKPGAVNRSTGTLRAHAPAS